jgi:hypothetical protein
MAEVDSETADPFVSGVRITHIITRRIFTFASLYTTFKCSDKRTRTGATDVYAASLIFYKFIVDKRITKANTRRDFHSCRQRRSPQISDGLLRPNHPQCRRR